MPSPLESRAALKLLTGTAVADAVHLLSQSKGSPDARRAVLFEGIPSVVGYYSDGSSALAADLYDDERAQARVRSRFTALPIVKDPGDKMFNAIAWAAQPLTDGAEQAAQDRLAGVVQLNVARPYRDTILLNRKRDPEAAGWKRVCTGGCAFCQMLAGRGSVYKSSTVRFASHPHCHCTAVPVFGTGDYGPEATDFQYIASRKTRTPAQRAALQSYLATYYPSN